MDCPPGQNKEGVVERWSLWKGGSYWRLNRMMKSLQ